MPVRIERARVTKIDGDERIRLANLMIRSYGLRNIEAKPVKKLIPSVNEYPLVISTDPIDIITMGIGLASCYNIYDGAYRKSSIFTQLHPGMAIAMFRTGKFNERAGVRYEKNSARTTLFLGENGQLWHGRIYPDVGYRDQDDMIDEGETWTRTREVRMLEDWLWDRFKAVPVDWMKKRAPPQRIQGTVKVSDFPIIEYLDHCTWQRSGSERKKEWIIHVTPTWSNIMFTQNGNPNVGNDDDWDEAMERENDR